MNKRLREKIKKIKIRFINGMAKDLKGDLTRGWDTFGDLGGFDDLIKEHKLFVDKVKKKHNIVDDELIEYSPLVVPINYLPDGNPFADIFDSKFVIFKMAKPPSSPKSSKSSKSSKSPKASKSPKSSESSKSSKSAKSESKNDKGKGSKKKSKTIKKTRKKTRKQNKKKTKSKKHQH